MLNYIIYLYVVGQSLKNQPFFILGFCIFWIFLRGRDFTQSSKLTALMPVRTALSLERVKACLQANIFYIIFLVEYRYNLNQQVIQIYPPLRVREEIHSGQRGGGQQGQCPPGPVRGASTPPPGILRVLGYCCPP